MKKMFENITVRQDVLAGRPIRLVLDEGGLNEEFVHLTNEQATNLGTALLFAAHNEPPEMEKE